MADIFWDIALCSGHFPNVNPAMPAKKAPIGNIVIRKLLSWKPSYDAMKDLGFGDFKHGGSVIILTKETEE